MLEARLPVAGRDVAEGVGQGARVDRGGAGGEGVWDELNRNSSSGKTDSQKEKRSSGSPKCCSIKKVLRENLTAVHRRTAIQQKILGDK